MPNVDPTMFGLEGKQPQELEQRRREIVAEIQRFPQSYDDPGIPLPLLQELALVAGMLRRRTAGPPRAAPKARVPAPKMTPADLMALLKNSKGNGNGSA